MNRLCGQCVLIVYSVYWMVDDFLTLVYRVSLIVYGLAPSLTSEKNLYSLRLFELIHLEFLLIKHE
jgi:hypothetical protein